MAMEKIIIHIKELLQVRQGHSALRGSEIKELPSISDAWIHLKNGRIEDFGAMSDCPTLDQSVEHIDATGRLVFPAYCDSHSHLVYAATREQEFVDRIHGLTYQEIAAKGGGILNSARKLREMPEDELFAHAQERLAGLVKKGTGALEIKSGYGLSVESELKMLRVAKRLAAASPVMIKSTFLGAHAIPAVYKDKREDYISLIISEMIPQVADEKLADYIDVFCETNYFTVDETDRILTAGAAHGLKPKIHVNQFTSIGGVKVGLKHHAVSVDHLEEMAAEDFNLLEGSQTIATALPSCSFFLGIPYTPVKEMIKRDIAIALATDFNPGSTPSGNMNFVFSLACIKMGLTPHEALNAMTINGAAAMELQHELGSISKGKRAHLIISKPIDGLARIPYSFGEDLIEQVIIGE